MAPDSLNIILFGETGVGKSSVINLIAGEQVAGTSSDAVGCTMSSTLHEFSIKGRQFHIWDTVGLEEPTMGVNGYLPAIEKSIELIQRLSSQSGVDLLLMCIRGNRLTATTQSNYRLFYEGLCGSKVPIAFVITHLEWEDDMEDWWTRNVKHVENFGMKCAGHACITTLKKSPQYVPSQFAVKDLLMGYNGTAKFIMPPDAWYIQLLSLFGLFVSSRIFSGWKLRRLLTKRCRLDPKVAGEIVKMIEGKVV